MRKRKKVKSKMIFCFDIDQTILFTELENETYFVKSVNCGLIRTINRLYDNGHLILLNTARHWNKYSQTVEQLKSNNVKYHNISFSKPVADYYIDDKAVTPEGFIEQFQNFS